VVAGEEQVATVAAAVSYAWFIIPLLKEQYRPMVVLVEREEPVVLVLAKILAQMVLPEMPVPQG
jgi:hypothetical protein